MCRIDGWRGLGWGLGGDFVWLWWGLKWWGLCGEDLTRHRDGWDGHHYEAIGPARFDSYLMGYGRVGRIGGDLKGFKVWS